MIDYFPGAPAIVFYGYASGFYGARWPSYSYWIVPGTIDLDEI